MKDSLKMVKRKVKDLSCFKMVMSIFVCIRMIWHMVKELIFGKQGSLTKVNGLKANEKATEFGLGNFESNIEVNGRIQKLLEKELSFGPTETHLWVSSSII